MDCCVASWGRPPCWGAFGACLFMAGVVCGSDVAHTPLKAFVLGRVGTGLLHLFSLLGAYLAAAEWCRHCVVGSAHLTASIDSRPVPAPRSSTCMALLPPAAPASCVPGLARALLVGKQWRGSCTQACVCWCQCFVMQPSLGRRVPVDIDRQARPSVSVCTRWLTKLVTRVP